MMKPSVRSHTIKLLALAALTTFSPCPSVQAAQLAASNGQDNDQFGSSASRSGAMVLAGARQADGPANYQGAAYLFRNLDTAVGLVTENARLAASDGRSDDLFGAAASLSGNLGVICAAAGGTYLYHDLDTASGVVTENGQLTVSAGSPDGGLSASASLQGTLGVIGSVKAAYLFRNLDSATGIVTQNATLAASDRQAGIGSAVSVSANRALVASSYNYSSTGFAYLFSHLDTATGLITEDARLAVSDGSTNTALYRNGVSLSGSMALFGLPYSNNEKGSAYLYRNLDTAHGTVTESARLVTPDLLYYYELGYSVSLSGSVGLLGVRSDEDSDGAVYIYRHLDTATGKIYPDVKIKISRVVNTHGGDDDFGGTSSLDGDRFAIAADREDGYSGRIYTGNVSSLTTLDFGHVSQVISKISFIAYGDWIIGEQNDANSLLLGRADNVQVLRAGKAIYIGKNAGSDNNVLAIQGKVAAQSINIGSLAGNFNNRLRLDQSSALSVTFIRLAPNNQLSIQGNYLDPNALASYLKVTKLQVYARGQWQTYNAGNFNTLLVGRYSGGYTILQPKY